MNTTINEKSRFLTEKSNRNEELACPHYPHLEYDEERQQRQQTRNVLW